MIEFENVTKFFDNGNKGKKFVFKSLNLKFPDSKNIAIIGKSNSGKSTLIKLINGSIFPSQGKINSSEKISWPMGTKNFMKNELSAKENTYIVAKLQCLSDEEAKEKIEYVKIFSELGDDFETEIKVYSNSMKNKLAVAISLAFDFDTYLIDDSSTFRDLTFKDKFEQDLNFKINNGSRIILGTNEPKVAKKMCNHFFVIKNYTLNEFTNFDEAELFFSN